MLQDSSTNRTSIYLDFLIIHFPAVADGALQPIISLCGMKEHIALLAVMTLSLIVEHHANLAALVEVFTFTFEE